MKEQEFIVKQNFDIENLNYKIAEKKIAGLIDLVYTKKLCFFIFDYYKHDYYYIKSFNEYFNEIPDKISEPYLFFNLKIHKEDRVLVKKIHYRAFDFVFSLPSNNRKNLRLYYNCRMQNDEKKHQMTDITLNVLATDNNGSIWLVLFIIEKSTFDNFKIPHIEIPNTNKLEMFDFKIELFDRLTSTEKKVSKLLFSKLSNKEIADKLYRSVNTIKSHLKNIYLETETNNRLEFQKKILLK